jgi:hypothetical protein
MQSTRAVPQDLVGLGEVCASMGSPFFGALLRMAADAYEHDAALRELLDRHAHRSRIGLRLGGAAHFRALRGQAPDIAAHYPSTGGDGDVDAAWRAVLADIHANVSTYDRLFERQVQTNEVARAMPVLGAMLALAQATRMPLRIFEIGSSAGLVLNFDRYRYSGEGWTWGDPASPAQLRNRIASGVPLYLDAPLQVIERRGCDLNPLDPANADDADTLLGFIWPDQRERFARLRAAIEIARRHPVEIASGDGIAWSRAMAIPSDGAATVLLHTVMTEHMPAADLQSLADAIDELARQAAPSRPFAWVRMEPAAPRGYHTTLTCWPGAQETVIAASDGHAQNLRWYP